MIKLKILTAILTIILTKINIILTIEDILETSSIYLPSSSKRKEEIETINFLNTDIIFQKNKYINYSSIDEYEKLTLNNKYYIIPEKQITESFYNRWLLGGFLNNLRSSGLTNKSTEKEKHEVYSSLHVRTKMSEAWLNLLNYGDTNPIKKAILKECKKRLTNVYPLNCAMNIQKNGDQFYSWSVEDEICKRPIYIETDNNSPTSIDTVTWLLLAMGDKKYKELISSVKTMVLTYFLNNNNPVFDFNPEETILVIPSKAKIYNHYRKEAPRFNNRYEEINNKLLNITEKDYNIGKHKITKRKNVYYEVIIDEYVLAYLNHMKYMVATDVCLSMKEILKTSDTSDINFFVGRVYKDGKEMDEVLNLNNLDYFLINKTIKFDRTTRYWKTPSYMIQESYKFKSPLLVYKSNDGLHKVINTETEGKKWVSKKTKDTNYYCNNRTCIYLDRNNNQIYKVDTDGSYIWFEERIINMTDVSPTISKLEIEKKLRDYYCSMRNCTVKDRGNNKYGLLYRILNTEILWNTATDYINQVSEFSELDNTKCEEIPKESHFSMDLYMAILNLIHPIIPPTAQAIDTIANLLIKVKNSSVTISKVYETLEILSNQPSPGFNAIMNTIKNQTCVNKMVNDYVNKTRQVLNEYNNTTRTSMCSLEWRSLKVDTYPKSVCWKKLKDIDNRLKWCKEANIHTQISIITFPGNTIPTIVYCHMQYSGKTCYIPDVPGNDLSCPKKND